MKRYSYLPGVLLAVAMIVRAIVAGSWTRADLAPVGVGLVLIAASAAWNRRELRAWYEDRRGAFAVASALSVILMVGILVLLNVLAWYRPARLDLTASGRNTVSRETIEVIRSLSRDVTLREFGVTKDPRISQLLASFAAAAGRVTAVFVDVEANPEETRRFGVVKPGTVIVASGEKYRKVESPTEQAIATAVLQVSRDEVKNVCVVGGHGEPGLEDRGGKGLSTLAATLAASNYATDRIGLLEDGIDTRCSVFVLAGPTRELERAELDRLTSLARRGARVAVLVDPPPGISMVAWLTPWGIVPRDGIAVDTSGAGQTVGGGPQTPLALAYGDHQITRGFGTATIYDWARPLTLIEYPDITGKPVALALTTERSFEETEFRNNTLQFDEDRDPKGPLTLAAAKAVWTRPRADRPPSDPPEGPPINDEARLVVVGDADFITNAYVRRQGNLDFFLRSVSWLAGETEALVVRVDERENRRIDLTERSRLVMYLVNLVLLPLIPLTAGVVVFLRSRR